MTEIIIIIYMRHSNRDYVSLQADGSTDAVACFYSPVVMLHDYLVAELKPVSAAKIHKIRKYCDFMEKNIQNSSIWTQNHSYLLASNLPMNKSHSHFLTLFPILLA